MILGHEIGEQDISQQLQQTRVHVKHGEEEEQRDPNAKQVPQCRLARRNPNVETSKRVGNKQAEDELEQYSFKPL